MTNLYEAFKKYKVTDVSSVEEFLKKYMKNDRFMDCIIDSYTKELKKNGYCFITHHSSVTGEYVSYYQKLKLSPKNEKKLKQIKKKLHNILSTLPDRKFQDTFVDESIFIEK